MTALLLGSVIVLGIAVLIIIATLRELVQQLQQLRIAEMIHDDSRDVDFTSGVELGSLGIYGLSRDSLPNRFAIVILSTSCSTCARIAQSVPKKRNANVLIAVSGPGHRIVEEWLQSAELELDGQRVVIDEQQALSTSIGATVVPSATLFEDGLAVRSLTLPSPRRLNDVFDWIHGLGDLSSSTEQGINDSYGSERIL